MKQPTLSHITQVRFTDTQDALIRECAAATGRTLSALIRNIVVVWAANHADEGTVDVAGLIAELQTLDEGP